LFVPKLQLLGVLRALTIEEIFGPAGVGFGYRAGLTMALIGVD